MFIFSEDGKCTPTQTKNYLAGKYLLDPLVVRDVEQCDLLHVVSIVPTLVRYLLAQLFQQLPKRLRFDVEA